MHHVHATRRWPLRRNAGRNAEVDDFDLARVLIVKDVGGVDIFVDDARIVHNAQCIGDLDRD